MKNQKGITLIALVITIIILIILASVAISTMMNEGIIEHAQIQQNIVQNKFDNLNSLLQEQNNYLNNVAIHDHIYDSGVITTPATCTETGVKTYSCTISGCTYTRTSSISALGHDYSKQTASSTYLKTAATCTTKAVYYKNCSRCGAKGTATFESGDALGHDLVPNGSFGLYNEYYHAVLNDCTMCSATNIHKGLNYHKVIKTTQTAATCTTKGTSKYTCEKCGYSYTLQDIAATGHTSTKGGTKEVHTKCSKCGVTLSSTHSYTKTTQTAATCTTKGTSKYICSCGYSYTSQDIPALGHDLEPNGKYTWYNETKHIMLEDCKRCSARNIQTELENHSFTNYTSNNDETCTEDGTKTAKCDKCTATKTITNTGSALGHDYSKQTASSTYLKTAATCTSPAVYYKSCSRCGEKGTSTFESGSTLGHNFTNNPTPEHIYTEATCTSPAIYFVSCSRCRL